MHTCALVSMYVCCHGYLNERNLEEIRVMREDAAKRQIK